MSPESNHDNPDRNNRGQRLLAYLGIAAFATGITVTLGTMLGVGSSSESPSVNEPEPAATSEYSQPADDTAHENGLPGEAMVFIACVGGLAVYGGVIAYRSGADMIREYTNVHFPRPELHPGADQYIDEKFKQMVEPMRGTMTECGW